MALIDDSKPLPGFRRDLRCYKGPDDADGYPTHTLFDPVSGRYYLLNWREHIVWQRLRAGVGFDDFLTDLRVNSTADIDRDSLRIFLSQCLAHGLMQIPLSSSYLEKAAKSKEQGWFTYLLFHYLFLKIPLFNPDRFLTQTVRFVRPLGSQFALLLYLIFGLVGLGIVFVKWQEYTGQFSYFFNLEGIVKYAAAICVVKCIHELSHAYTAKRYGLYVPSMGIAFIVLFPLLFTDVTNAWKLRSRHQRLLISAAGILAETILAGLSTIGWLLTEPGTLHNILFVVSSTTWVSTLAVNLNPVIRYDGYYILADLWGVDNLHQRAFRVAKWKLRDWLLGLKGDNPEPALPPRYIPGLVLFSLFTWFWRLSIFLAIAWIIYVRFTKAIGLLLIVFQMAVYIGWPIVSEVRAVFGMRQQFSWNPRALLTVSLLSIGLVWLVIPFPHSVSFSGVTSPSAEQVIYVPYHSTIKNVPALRGAQVKAGDLLIELDSVELSYQTHSLRAEIALLEQRIDQYALDEEKKALIPQVRAERASKLIRLQGLQEIKDRLTIEADQDGVVDMLAEGLRPGLQVRQDQVLAKISAPSALEVIFYVPARYIGDIQAGDAIRFETFPSKTSYQGKITSVNPVRETRLPYAALESRFGGDIATIAERDGKGVRLVDSYYPVRAELELGEEAFPRFGRTGTIEMRGPVRSILVDYITHTLALFWREGGF